MQLLLFLLYFLQEHMILRRFLLPPCDPFLFLRLKVFDLLIHIADPLAGVPDQFLFLGRIIGLLQVEQLRPLEDQLGDLVVHRFQFFG